MKTLTFALQKGGTGKTSISVSIAVELANNDYKVLFIDADPQGNASSWLFNKYNIQYELADILQDTCTIQKAIYKSDINNLSFIATAGITGTLREYESKSKLAKVKNSLRNITKDFDYCIIDTSPNFNNFEKSLFFASNEVITVLQIDDFSKHGLQIFTHKFNEYLKDDLDADAIKPVFNKIILNAKNDNFKLHNIILNQFREIVDAGYNVYTIPQDQSFKNCQAMNEPIQNVTKKQETLNAIKLIAKDIIKGD